MKNLKGRGGYTLVEMLCVIVVVLLASAAMAAGIQYGCGTFVRSMSVSEAQMLCATLSTAVADELRFAGSITGNTAETIRFFSQDYGKNARFFTDETGQILIVTEESGAEKQYKLVPSASYTYGNQAELKLVYSETEKLFTVDLVIRGRKEDVLAENHFPVRKLN